MLFHRGHLPDAAGTDGGAESTADAQVIINHVFITAIFGFLAGDGPLVAGLFADTTVAA